MRRVAFLVASLACAAGLPAQQTKRLPIIAGSNDVNVLVELDGTVKSWGSPFTGSGAYLGDGTDGQATRKELAPVPGMHDIIGAAVGGQQVLLLSRDGTVFTWGRNNHCELGTGDTNKQLTPVVIAGLQGVTQVAATNGLSGAVLADGSVMMWGSSRIGLLGNGLTGDAANCAKSPIKVDGLTGVVRLAMDGSNVIVLKKDGTVWGWGKNANGELCDGTTERRVHPVQMQGITNAVDIGADANTVVVLADGTVRTCGSNVDGEMGASPKNPSPSTPFKVAGVAGAVAVQIAAGATMVRLGDGTLLGWGVGYQGRLGDGHGARPYAPPHPPVGLGPVLVHYFASNSGYAIRADGQVMAWGIFWANGVGPTEWVLKPIPFFKVKLPE
jgi:alpha-tubulin suppressor-like RCC1 family protein